MYYITITVLLYIIMHTSTITSKGQVTIPAQMRKRLGLVPGGRVAFGIQDGRIVLEAVKDDITAAFGMLKSDKAVGIEEMDQAIEQGIATRFRDGIAADEA